jgi:hypothetical protein
MHPVIFSLCCFAAIVGAMVLAKLTGVWRTHWGVIVMVCVLLAFGVLFTWILFRKFVRFD